MCGDALGEKIMRFQIPPPDAPRHKGSGQKAEQFSKQKPNETAALKAISMMSQAFHTLTAPSFPTLHPMIAIQLIDLSPPCKTRNESEKGPLV